MSLEVSRLRAVASPVRLRILSLLTATPMSATEVAAELGVAHASASYHLRKLHDAGLLDVVEERVVRGGKERRYRHDPASGDRLGGDQAPVFHESMIRELRRRLAERAARPGGNFSDAELWVRPEVWDEVVSQVVAAMVRLHDEALPPRTPGAHKVSATVALFRMKASA
jgi:DNA-binding transcriptional ArsR family regulator